MQDKFLKLTNTVYKLLDFFPESDPLKYRAKDRALVIMKNLTLVSETSGWMSFNKEKVKLQISEDIDILLGYLWIGKTQGWLNSANCLIITSEYEKIKKEFTLIIELPQQIPDKDEPSVEEEYAQSEFQSSSNFLTAEEAEVGEEDINFAESLILQGSGEAAAISPGSNAKYSHELTARQKKIIDFLTSNERAQVMDLKKVLPDVTKRTIRRDLDELMESGKIVRFGDFNQVFYQIKHLS